MANKLKCNDKVIVITGKYKGIIGNIVKIVNNKKVIIKGVNLVTKHQKPIPSQNIPGSIIKKELPIDISNVAILNPINNKADRIGFKIYNNKKIRFFKSNKTQVGIV